MANLYVITARKSQGKVQCSKPQARFRLSLVQQHKFHVSSFFLQHLAEFFSKTISPKLNLSIIQLMPNKGNFSPSLSLRPGAFLPLKPPPRRSATSSQLNSSYGSILEGLPPAPFDATDHSTPFDVSYSSVVAEPIASKFVGGLSIIFLFFVPREQRSLIFQ